MLGLTLTLMELTLFNIEGANSYMSISAGLCGRFANRVDGALSLLI